MRKERERLGETGSRAVLYEGVEITEEPAYARPSQRADLNELAPVIGAMRNIADEAFLVQADQRFAERAQPDGEGREQSAAGEDRALVFVQEQQDLNLELAQPDPRAGIADRTRSDEESSARNRWMPRW